MGCESHTPTSSRSGSAGCARCERLGRTCPSCVQRRHIAWRLIDRDGLTVDEAAAKMQLPSERVCELLRAERERRELAAYRIDSIPTARARAFLERELQRDPSLSRAEVAHRMGMAQSDFDRAFGYAPVKGGGRRQRSVTIPTASRLARALGRAPVDLEGC
jgi:plasmid maintenance system antidote protein VapI